MAKPRVWAAWLILSIAAGVILRFLCLETRPLGLDSDQALVVVQGIDDLNSGRWALFQPAMTRFETFTAYLYALTWKAFGSARPLALMLSLAELVLLFVLVRRHRGPRVALVATMILAVSPWHWFYSRVTGPCVGAGLLLLAYVALRGRRERFLVLIAGWFYYGLLRLLWLWEWRRFREKKWFLFYGASATVVIVLSLFSGLSWFEILSRGDYNHAPTAADFGLRVESWLRLWFGMPGRVLREGAPGLIVDPVSQGLARLSSWPLLSLAGVALLLTMLVAARKAEFRRAVGEPLGLFLFGAVALVLSPTPSHGLMWLPLFAWLGAEALEKTWKPWATLLLIALPLNGLWQSADLLEKMKPGGPAREIFQDRWRPVADQIAREFPADRFQVYLLAHDAFLIARYEALAHDGWTPLLAADPAELEEILRTNAGDGREQIVLIDRARPHLPDHRLEGFFRGYDLLSEFSIRLHERATVLESRSLPDGERTSFDLHRVRWP